MPKINKRIGVILGIGILVMMVWASGFLTGWWISKGKMGSFPIGDEQTRLLVIAPHPDDEVLTAGGLIQRVIAAGGRVKIIYLTSGDGSRSEVVRENKKADLAPEEFLQMGEQRMQEAAAATAILGVERKDVVFLGFPDQALQKVVSGSGVSPTTKFDHVPYEQALVPGQAYTEENLVEDVASVAGEFRPTVVVTTHPRDRHPDHKAAFEVSERVREKTGDEWALFAALVHYKNYPGKGDFLFPPRKLFGSDWVSLELTDAELSKKREAIKSFGSQYADIIQRRWLEKMTAKNEIWERE